MQLYNYERFLPHRGECSETSKGNSGFSSWCRTFPVITIKAMLPTLLCKTNRQLHPTRCPQVQICKSKQNKDCRDCLQTKPKLLKGLVNLSVKCGHNSRFCHSGTCQGKVCDENWGTTFCHLHLTGELTQDKPFLLPDVTSDQAIHPPNPVTVLTSAIANEIINKTTFFIRSTVLYFLHSTVQDHFSNSGLVHLISQARNGDRRCDLLHWSKRYRRKQKTSFGQLEGSA